MLRKWRINQKKVRTRKGLEIILRQVTASDIPEIYQIEKLSFKDPYPPSLLETLAILSNDTFIVAEYDKHVVGYVIGTLRWDVVGHIINIAIHPDFRRKGIGEVLMKEVMKALKKKGATMFRLEVRISNIPAQCLYEKLGFRKVGVIPNYYSDGEACYVMVKRDP
ncbi:MAG: ribosomal-protein-alanine N-acetyltransferase [Thermoprotei archaeon]|nr:MAG: ribosomal-protein-alanine N-acetyltransferase [Thermoprotei archaeon]RLF19877.1 MAG: ribosomal-protein-alanine N-acetyltransferase [Thermoprotei archaeon]